MTSSNGAAPTHFGLKDLQEVWRLLAPGERAEAFQLLPHDQAAAFFHDLGIPDQIALLRALPNAERRLWMRILAPDDAADVLQLATQSERVEWLGFLNEPTRLEVSALMAYAEDDAGGLMNPRFVRLRPEMTVDEAITYLRRQTRDQHETIYYLYVLDPQQKLLGALSVRELFTARGDQRVQEVMKKDLVTVPEDMDQEAVAKLLATRNFVALPVVDKAGHMRGIVTVDDIVDVVQEEATEDMQKMGGMEALDTPYLQTGFFAMVKKRAGWLAILFLGEMLTASAMSRYEGEIAKATVLALFIPLIISSGGNSGSQATTLVIRAMALGEVTLREWWRVVRRELAAGFALGAILATIGLVRILIWQAIFQTYDKDHYGVIAITVALSLIGIVTWGTVAGSMLPFILRRLGFDPASSSAPFVATLVDVSGLMIYFNIAYLVMRGTLL
ncbi:MAG: magnesium transporter [Planctomycetota bacterium]|nr:magnesium transporter [Planctomycetota bacterium]